MMQEQVAARAPAPIDAKPRLTMAWLWNARIAQGIGRIYGDDRWT
jgi:hypothetical protein